MSDEPTLADLIEELIDLKTDLRLWEESMRKGSDERIAEIKSRIEAVKEKINAKGRR